MQFTLEWQRKNVNKLYMYVNVYLGVEEDWKCGKMLKVGESGDLILAIIL